jgi:hypothetical protein
MGEFCPDSPGRRRDNQPLAGSPGAAPLYHRGSASGKGFLFALLQRAPFCRGVPSVRSRPPPCARGAGHPLARVAALQAGAAFHTGGTAPGPLLVLAGCTPGLPSGRGIDRLFHIATGSGRQESGPI